MVTRQAAAQSRAMQFPSARFPSARFPSARFPWALLPSRAVRQAPTHSGPREGTGTACSPSRRLPLTADRAGSGSAREIFQVRGRS
jgi:hypothetical protein